MKTAKQHSNCNIITFKYIIGVVSYCNRIELCYYLKNTVREKSKSSR